MSLPIRHTPRSWLWSAVMLGAIVWSCADEPEKFYARIYNCDISAADPACGTDIRGRPLQCFAARQLGASDFCAETCGENGQPPVGEEDSVCLTSGVRLDSCHPSDDSNPVTHPQGACGSKALGCLRTDLVADEGVCLPLGTCSKDADCHDPIRSVCSGGLVTGIHGPQPGIKTDHLYCLQVDCHSNQTACAPGETCLIEVVRADQGAPDICVPNCDSASRCPPNHACNRKLYGPTAPNICVPGLISFRCETAMDCMVGDCVCVVGDCTDAAPGFRVCAPPCQSDADCVPFDRGFGPFLCTADKLCVSAASFLNEICSPADPCNQPGDMCVIQDSPIGRCAPPCEADRVCKAYGGLNHACIVRPAPAGGGAPPPPYCVPGVLGTPCETNSSCIGTLGCQQVGMGTKICSFPCANDAECAANRWTADGWCGPLSKCATPLEDGADCDRAAQCASKVCALEEGKKRCSAVAVPGSAP